MADYSNEYKKNIYIFTFALSLSGTIFGINISFLNVVNIQAIRTNSGIDDYLNMEFFNVFFALGGLACCLVGGFFIRKISRKYLNYICIITNIICTSFLQTDNEILFSWSRFIVGFIGTFYTFLTPIIFQEYFPRRDAGKLGSFFFVGLAAGSCLTIIVFANSKSVLAARLVFLTPIFLELIRLGIFIFVFNQESPRSACLQVFRRHFDIVEQMCTSERCTASKRDSIEKMNLEIYDLKEDDEDQMLEEGLLTKTEPDPMLLKSKKTGSKFYKIKEELKELVKSDKNILYYFHSFYGEDKFENKFDEFCDDFFGTFQENLISKKVIPWNMFSLIFSESYRLQFFIVLLLNFMSQMAGVNCFMFYSDHIFQNFSGLNKPIIYVSFIGNPFFLYFASLGFDISKPTINRRISAFNQFFDHTFDDKRFGP